MKSLPSLERQLAELPKLDLPGLADQYQHLYGKRPPRRLSRSSLQLAVAYRLQRLLTARLRSKMAQVLNAGEAIVSILSSNSTSTELIREWKGRVHTVTVLDEGVFYQGQRFASLSAVADQITGRKISGAEFFGSERSADSGHETSR